MVFSGEMVWSFKPWRKKVGQLTPRMFALLSKASFATSWPRYPTNSFARDFTLTKGLTRKGSWLGLLEKLEGDPCPDGPAHDDDVLLLEAELGGGECVDEVCVIDDGLGAGLALVDAVAGVLHGEDVDLRGGKGTW